MKTKLKKGILKKYGFHVGGDMSESLGIAVDFFGKILTKEEMKSTSCKIMTFHVCDEELEFLVIDHKNPLPKEQYDDFSQIFENINAK